jgi:hypothetical protein
MHHCIHYDAHRRYRPYQELLADPDVAFSAARLYGLFTLKYEQTVAQLSAQSPGTVAWKFVRHMFMSVPHNYLHAR